MLQEIYKSNRYEILTPSGWCDFDGLVITKDQNTVNISIDSNNLTCTAEHRVINNGELIEAQHLEHSKNYTKEDVYDLLNVDKGNLYYTNGIISHNCLFIDEAAHIENWEQFFTSTAPTITSGKSTKIILVSTPNGLNHFYKTFSEAVRKENDYYPIEVRWDKVPGRDEEWKRKTLSQMGNDLEKFDQEHNCSFQGSSGTLIAGWKLKELTHQVPIHNKNNEVLTYEAPIKGHVYVGTLDVSRGKGLDYSVVQIIDVTKMPYKQVCTVRSNLITPQDFASIAFTTLKSYNNALALVEINDIGGQVADILFDDYEYENLLFTASAGPRGKVITAGFGRASDRGIRTTRTVKNVGCSVLKLLVEQNQIIINDHNTINELNTFSKKHQTYEAEPGCHDDLVMCLVLFGWLSAQQYFKDYTDINTLGKLRDKTDEELEYDLLPFFVDDGEDLREKEQLSNQNEIPIIDSLTNF